jgi:hypothetical protein
MALAQLVSLKSQSQAIRPRLLGMGNHQSRHKIHVEHQTLKCETVQRYPHLPSVLLFVTCIPCYGSAPSLFVGSSYHDSLLVFFFAQMHVLIYPSMDGPLVFIVSACSMFIFFSPQLALYIVPLTFHT